MSNLSVNTAERPVVYKAGSVIFSKGNPPKHLYLVKSGRVRLIKFNGQHLNAFELCEAGAILNEVSVLMNEANQYAAIAQTDTELILVEQKDILNVIKGSPSWIPDIFKTLCERLKATQEMIEEHNLSVGEKDAGLIINKEDEKKYIEALAAFNSKS
jgi:CRP-like cAMP-binding protein